MGIKNLKTVSPDEAVKVIRSGDHVHISATSNTPACLVAALCRRGRSGELGSVHIHHLHTEGPAPYADPSFEGVFQLDSFFVGPNVRSWTQQGYADYIPVFLGETQRLYREGYLPCDVALIQVSPPDEQGHVSLGTSVDASVAAVEKARIVIAVINPHVPHTYGDGLIPADRIHLFVEDGTPLETVHFAPPGDVEAAIGKHCASLIEDGATLQMGIGAIPNAVLAQLSGHKNLHRNDRVLMKDVGYTNDPFIIAKNPKATAINSALQIDLTGQICADSLGTKCYSGVGGQIDFFYGASRSAGGKPILAMPSVTEKGVSKIAPVLLPGAGVVTTRAHAHWLVTEFGAVNLYGRSLQERARLIIGIAHPDHRETLDRAAFERFGPHYHFVRT